MNQKPPAAGKGRPKGALNKATVEIKGLAQPHGSECVDILLAIARTSRSPQARVAAVKLLLEYGFGKPKETVDLKAELTIPQAVQFILTKAPGADCRD